MSYAAEIDSMAGDIYRYMNFNEIESYQKAAASIPVAQL